MKEIAEKYLSYGLNVVPVGNDKKPRVSEWTSLKTNKAIVNGQFDEAWGIAVFGGHISGNLEFIDVDCKYDLTGKLFDEFKKSVSEIDKNLLKKLVVETTINKGYHLIYRCSEISGNTKLARRPTIESERINEKDKIKDLIETRGEGGYCVVYPSPNYKLIYGSFDKINEITPSERAILFNCARSFNTYYTEPIIKPKFKKIINDLNSPFEAYNQNGDIVSLLELNGWKIVQQKPHKMMMLRPGGTQNWSAEYDTDKKLFYVWSSSTEFENEKAYNHSQVLTTLKFNGDYSESAKWLLENGFGERTEVISKKEKREMKSIINPDDDNFDFVAGNKDTDDYIQSIRNGSFKMGLSTGFPKLDDHFRIKPSSLVVIIGRDNVGKSVISWYLAMITAKLHGWKWILFSAENKTGGIKKKIIEFKYSQEIKRFTDEKLEEASKWFDEHFTIINNDEDYNYMDMINMATKLLKKKKYDAFLIDPFNSLDTEEGNKHDNDYKILRKFRLFIKKTGCCIYVNCHVVSDTLRRVYPKDHKYAGYEMPPKKADAEGGGKFSNKADDILVIDRLVKNPNEFMWTHIHVEKIKESETGGRQTFIDNPVKLRMTIGSLGFEDEDGFNPITNTVRQEQLAEDDYGKDEDVPF